MNGCELNDANAFFKNVFVDANDGANLYGLDSSGNSKFGAGCLDNFRIFLLLVTGFD